MTLHLSTAAEIFQLSDSRPSGVLFIPGATPDQARQIQHAALLPEGTLVFHLDGRALYEQAGSFTVLEIPSGETLLWVARDDQHRLRYVHSSPGTGTREAVLDLREPTGDDRIMVSLTWSASEARIYVGSGGDLRQGDGVATARQFRVGADGVYSVGDDGVEVAAYQVFRNGESVLRETAIELWKQTSTALDIHMQSSVAEGYIGEVVQANLALVMLATGFEGYCGRRFSEIPREGRKVDLNALASRIRPKPLMPAGPLTSLDEVLRLARIDFGNYQMSRVAFRKAYGLSFADDLGVPTRTRQAVSRMLRYRNRIVHVSPLVAMLNQGQVPPQKPVFSSRSLVEELRRESGTFVDALHQATLRLPRREDEPATG